MSGMKREMIPENGFARQMSVQVPMARFLLPIGMTQLLVDTPCTTKKVMGEFIDLHQKVKN